MSLQSSVRKKRRTWRFELNNAILNEVTTSANLLRPFGHKITRRHVICLKIGRNMP